MSIFDKVKNKMTKKKPLGEEDKDKRSKCADCVDDASGWEVPGEIVCKSCNGSGRES